MNISSTGSAANVNLGAVSRPVFGAADDSDHDNGRRAHGKPDSFRSDFRTLLEAVQSGDMTGAQSALASIKTDVGAASATYSPASLPPVPVADTETVDPSTTDAASSDASPATAPSTTSPASTIGSDLKALFDAVGSGDASSAQAALSTFVTDRQAAWQQAKSAASNSQGHQPGHLHGHHGHRHHSLESLIASLFSASASATTVPTSTEASSDSTADTTTTTSDSSVDSMAVAA